MKLSQINKTTWQALIFLNVVFTLSGVVFIIASIHKDYTWQKATGRVVDIIWRGKGSSLVVKFTPSSGDEVTFMDRSMKSSFVGESDIGKIVTVLYNPQNINDVEVKSFFGQYLLPAIFMFIGIISSLVVVCREKIVVKAHAR